MKTRCWKPSTGPKRKSAYKRLKSLASSQKCLLNHNKIQPEDWYTVTLADLQRIGFTGKVRKPELAELLAKKYPDYKWEKVYLARGRYAQQNRLEATVSSLFPVSLSLSRPSLSLPPPPSIKIFETH